MKIKAKYKTKEEVPEGYEDLYTEKGGEWLLTEVEGLATEANVLTLQNALAKERRNHKALQDKITELFGETSLEDAARELDGIEELRAKAEGGDNKNVDEIVERRLAAKTAPLAREVEKLTKANAKLETENETLRTDARRRVIHDVLRAAATEMKIVDTAIDDILLYGDRVFEVTEEGLVVAREGVGVTPGTPPKDWLSEMQPKRPHWWPPSQGGGANGGGGGVAFKNNPWSHDHWNLTEQARIENTDMKLAERMAKSAGTTVDGPKPKP